MEMLTDKISNSEGRFVVRSLEKHLNYILLIQIINIYNIFRDNYELIISISTNFKWLILMIGHNKLALAYVYLNQI